MLSFQLLGALMFIVPPFIFFGVMIYRFAGIKDLLIVSGMMAWVFTAMYLMIVGEKWVN